jgi:hypothetical protein
VIVNAFPGAYGVNDRMINIAGDNVAIFSYNLEPQYNVFDMSSAGRDAGSAQRHCFFVNGVNHVTIKGVMAREAGGDGLYISHATDVNVSQCVFDSNYRQGCSMTDAIDGVCMYKNTFSNSGKGVGGIPTGGPCAGIDVEPNTVAGGGPAPAQNFLKNIVIQDCISSGNAGEGIRLSLQNMTSAAAAPIDITIVGHSSQSNDSYGYLGLNANASAQTGGLIRVVNSFSSNDGYWAAAGRYWQSTGAEFRFEGLSITNPNRRGGDPSWGYKAAVACIQGGGNNYRAGNCKFISTNVQTTSALTDYYFYFDDKSGIGMTKVEFSPGTILTGAAMPGGCYGRTYPSGACVTNPSLIIP